MPEPPAGDPADAGRDASPDAPQRGRLRFGRRMRVLRRADFQRILKDGLRAADGRITLWALPNRLRHTRLGLTVGRQHGGAARRNRIKRVLREAFRLLQRELPPGVDLICAPRIGGDIELDGCKASLSRLSELLAARIGRRREEDAE